MRRSRLRHLKRDRNMILREVRSSFFFFTARKPCCDFKFWSLVVHVTAPFASQHLLPASRRRKGDSVRHGQTFCGALLIHVFIFNSSSCKTSCFRHFFSDLHHDRASAICRCRGLDLCCCMSFSVVNRKHDVWF